MAYKMGKNGKFVEVKTEKIKEESVANKLDAKIVSLQAEIEKLQEESKSKDEVIENLQQEIEAKDKEIEKVTKTN